MLDGSRDYRRPAFFTCVFREYAGFSSSHRRSAVALEIAWPVQVSLPETIGSNAYLTEQTAAAPRPKILQVQQNGKRSVVLDFNAVTRKLGADCVIGQVTSLSWDWCCPLLASQLKPRYAVGFGTPEPAAAVLLSFERCCFGCQVKISKQQELVAFTVDHGEGAEDYTLYIQRIGSGVQRSAGNGRGLKCPALQPAKLAWLEQVLSSKAYQVRSAWSGLQMTPWYTALQMTMAVLTRYSHG